MRSMYLDTLPVALDCEQGEALRERGKDGNNNEGERREATGVDCMVTEKRSLVVVWKHVRKMSSREKPSEIMDWIEMKEVIVIYVL